MTTWRGASQGPGVPPPAAAKFQTHQKYKAAPAAMTGTATQAAGAGVPPSRVSSRQGSQTAPRPGTTRVNTTLRTMRLSVRVIAPPCDM